MVATLVIVVSFIFGEKKEYEYFYRSHEKFTTKNKSYKKNVNSKIFMPHGDIYAIDSGLNKKRDLIKEPRQQEFITDNYGIRNNISEIKDAEIILVGDSFIAGTGNTQEYIPANILSELTNKKVASLSYGGLEPSHYEKFISNFLKIIKKDAKIYVFYFAGNDFTITKSSSNNKEIDNSKYIQWHGYVLPKFSGKIRIAYERLERNKDKFLLKVLPGKNYFLKTIRAKSHLMYRKFFQTIHNTNSPIKYFKISNETVGFYHDNNFNPNHKHQTYIFKDQRVLNRINGIFLIPSKALVYSSYIETKINQGNSRILYLESKYYNHKIPVYNLSKILQNKVEYYLKNNQFLFWKDDTHWNKNGILESMKFVKNKIND